MPNPDSNYSSRAKEAAEKILEAFQSGNLPKALAPIFIRRKEDTPCRKWSWSNQLLTALCGFDDARGFRQWEEVGRHVKKGEKSFPILVPLIRKWKEEDKENGEEIEKSVCYGFTSAAVFGYEQTDGEELPDLNPEVTAWVKDLPLREVAEDWGISVQTFNGEGADCFGRYRFGKSIALGVTNLSTWAHELVHAADDRIGTIHRVSGQNPGNEIVAELGGAILLEILGFNTESDRGGCWEYVQGYAKKEEVGEVVACQRLLKRMCDCVALVLDTAESLQGKAQEVDCAAF